MHRIFFDANDGTMELGYNLNFPTSKKDLDAVGNDLSDGLHVIIYSPNELEMEAILKFDHKLGFWVGRPIPGTITYLDES
jgi:hypothetical protein